MNLFSSKQSPFLPFLKIFSVILLPLLFFCSCKKDVDYFDYVSELRNNVFFAQTDNFSLRIYAVEKENPYVMDGIPKETSSRVEMHLTAPEGDKECALSFTVNEREFGGEMSYDNVKAEYYYSCTMDVSALKEIPCKIVYGKEEISLLAKSVLDGQTMTPKAALTVLSTEEKELFASLTDKYGFTGEIYLRVIYEDYVYYYIGVIDRANNVTAFLLNAKTGKILAKRQS